MSHAQYGLYQAKTKEEKHINSAFCELSQRLSQFFSFPETWSFYSDMAKDWICVRCVFRQISMNVFWYTTDVESQTETWNTAL